MPNRLVAQAMELNCAGAGGAVSQAVLDRYRSLARGKWGLVFVEAVSITEESLARGRGLILNRKNLDGFKRLVDTFKKENDRGLLMFQLTHSGRLSGSFSKQIKAYADNDNDIPIATTAELHAIRDAYIRSAELARLAGADGVDIKACHGYLAGELLRPLNDRQDEYGGIAENRAHLVSSVIKEVRKHWPDLIVGSRISLYEGIRGGCGTSGPDEVIEVLDDILGIVRHLVKAGADFINVSAGIPAITPQITRPAKDMYVSLYHHFRYAKLVRDHFADVAVIGSAYSAGRKRAASWAGENIRKGYVDLAGFGRQNLADPLYAVKLAEDPDGINYCKLCGGCSRLLKEQKQVLCTVYQNQGKNPDVYHKEHKTAS